MANPQHELLLKEADSHITKSEPRRIRSTFTFYEQYVQNGWLVEVLSIFIATVSIVVLCILLRRNDGKPIRSNTVVGVNITLNTLVSILSTIGRAALLLSVSECISQLKWTWYLDKHRPLKDLDTFDNASRGAWGGLQLLWKINIRYVQTFRVFPGHSTYRSYRQIASMGALLVVAGLAVDPLSQQLVHYRAQDVPDPFSSARLPVAVVWDDIQDLTFGKRPPQTVYPCTQTKDWEADTCLF